MSTRGVIAYSIGESWEGVYNHSDSYPTGLGISVQQWLIDTPDFEEFKKFIQAHLGGFSSFPETCYCHDEYFAARDGSCASDSPYFKEDAPSGQINPTTIDPLCHEYLYVVRSDLTIEIWGHKRVDSKKDIVLGAYRCEKDNIDKECWYTLTRLTVINLETDIQELRLEEEK